MYDSDGSGSLVFTRQQLISLNKPVLLPLRGLWSQRGAQEETIVTVRSPGNKTDELTALVRTQREYRDLLYANVKDAHRT